MADDPDAILQLLPERWHEIFQSDYAVFMQGWHLRALAYSSPELDRLAEAAAADTVPVPGLEEHQEDRAAAVRAAGMQEVQRSVLVLGERVFNLAVKAELQHRRLGEHGEMLAEILRRLPPEPGKAELDATLVRTFNEGLRKRSRPDADQP